MKLPDSFIKRMEKILGSDAGAFFAAHDMAPVKAFHLNKARIDAAAFEEWLSAQNGLFAVKMPGGYGYSYSFSDDSTIGSLPLHHAGAIYSQDPSAMLPAGCLDIQKDMRILDMCAAPGGKTSQLAMAVDGGSGFVLANEPNLSRNKILISNIERMGYRNVITSCLEPADIAAVYPEYFDLVLVDAPCSGEGMFRKYPDSINEWSPENVAACALRQKEILKAAVQCLKPGGLLVYSTCTYAPEEDEEQVEYLTADLGLTVANAPQTVRDLALCSAPGCYRCYPHLYEGEGQFMAYLSKPGELTKNSDVSDRLPSGIKTADKAALKSLKESCGDLFEPCSLLSYKDRYIILPAFPGVLPSHGITSLGVTAAVFDEKKKRYIPHHQFFSAYGKQLPKRLELDPGDPLVKQYIEGMELTADMSFSKGFGAVCVLGVPLGGFRCAGGRLKNLYPKGLRDHL